ncbi:hypothetical protein JCM3775_006577 [Rhodotorula graminis]
MGQAESQPQSGHGHAPASTGNSSTLAFHVLRVAENSPAAEVGIEPFFDFIVGAAGRQLGDDLDLLTDVLEVNEGGEVALQIYSTKRKEVREVYVIPSRTWSAAAGPGTTAGSVDGEPSLLGLSLRLCNPHHALDQVWHVLEILEGSPAQSAGLVPYGDWIVGYAGGVLRGEGDFYDVVEAHVDKPLRLFVYNSDYDVTREAILVPNRSWGGEGLLGCGVGYGLLHRIPKPQDGARPVAQAYDDDPYAAPAPPPVQRGPPPPSSSSQHAPAPPQQQQQQYRSPPPQQKNDRLTSFSSTSGKLPNPLYAPPPPRTTPSASRAPAASVSPPSAPAPRPARRTAALASFDDHHHGGGGASAPAQERSYYGDGDPYALDSSQTHSHGYGSTHPSFASYGAAAGGEDDDEGMYGGGGAGGGAYDASEGVEVVAVHEGDDYGDFARPSALGGSGGYGRPSAGGGGGGGRRMGSYGAARVVAEEAD